MNMRRARWLVFAVALVAALAALMPLRLALGWSGLARGGLSARAATGTIWHGTLRDAAFGPIALGDVEARLSAPPLLWGHARLALSRADADPLAGRLDVSRRGVSVEGATGRIGAGVLFAPAPIDGVTLDDVAVAFADGRCVSASGRVRAMPSGPIAAMLPGLAGSPRCDGDAVVLPLAAGNGRIDLRLAADGRYRIEATVSGVSPALAGTLEAAGFRPSGGGYALRREGAL
jgi:general secretion pathway protein N